MKIYFIGFGSVAHAVIEVWNLENLYKDIPITIIEPLNIDMWVHKGRKIKHIKQVIKESNVNKLLREIDSETLVIDLSVDVDCLMIIKKCSARDSYYINTSLENWTNKEEGKPIPKDYNKFKKDTLYYRQEELDKIKDNMKANILSNFGQNPRSYFLICNRGIK